MQTAFEQMNALMAEDVLCAYPNHNKPFHIFTDASNYQLDEFIMQDDNPVAYYSKKLNSAQMNYATIDKELLCVIATLCTFRSMLLGAELHIHTDHKNILNVGDSSEQRLRWISYVDEYSLTLHCVEGPRKIIADTFSRLLRQDDTSAIVGKKAITEDSELAYYSFADDRETFNCLINIPCLFSDKKQKQQKLQKHCKSNRSDSHQHHLIWIETNPNCHCPSDINATHCYLNLPTDMEEDNPLDIENIKEKQDEDNDLQQLQPSILNGIVIRPLIRLQTY
jgi:hypothetical protein